jgi:uncharacterized delta-60 repeat protein
MDSRTISRVGAFVSIALSSVAAAQGSVILDFGGDTEDALRSLRLGTDGRIYALVETRLGTDNCGVYALDTSGALIASFGKSGRMIPRVNCFRDLLVRADNSLVGGVDHNSSGSNLAFYDVNGKELSLSDTAFSLNSSHTVTGHALAQQADGQILMAGRSSYADTVSFWESFRWSADGKVDELYSTSGSDLFSGSTATADGIALASDGKIYVSGIAGANPFRTELRRFATDGSKDSTFAADGLYTVAGTVTAEKHARGGLAVDPTTGNVYLLTGNDVDVIRLTPAGAADAAFKTLTTPAGRLPQSIALDSSRRVVVAGVTSEASGATQGYVTRFTTTGALDTSFGAGTGLVYVPLTRPLVGTAPICKVAIEQSSGQLIVACTVDNNADALGYHASDLAIARLNVDGSLDKTFGAAQADPDYRPDAFTFTADSAPAGTANVQSNAVTISGIEESTMVRLQGTNADGSMFSVGCNNSFSKGPSRIFVGQTLCVRHNASATVGGTAQTGIDVGGVYVTYTTQSTAAAAPPGGDDGNNNPPNLLPNVSNFVSQNGVARSTMVVSNTATTSGFRGAITVTINNGEFSVGCGQTFTSSPTTMANGDKICIRHMSSPNFATTVRSDITFDSGTAQYSTSFISTTLGGTTTDNTSSKSGGGGALDYWVLSALGLIGALSQWMGARRRLRN